MSPVIKTVLIGFCGLGVLSLNNVGTKALDYINQLPLEGTLKQGVVLVSSQTPDPLVALKTDIPTTTTSGQGQSDVERSFVRTKGTGKSLEPAVDLTAPESEPAKPAVDVAALIKSQARVSGEATGGAFINGRFVALGAPALPSVWDGDDNKTPHVPRLKAVNERGVLLFEPKSKSSVFIKTAPAK